MRDWAHHCGRERRRGRGSLLSSLLNVSGDSWTLKEMGVHHMPGGEATSSPPWREIVGPCRGYRVGQVSNSTVAYLEFRHTSTTTTTAARLLTSTGDLFYREQLRIEFIGRCVAGRDPHQILPTVDFVRGRTFHSRSTPRFNPHNGTSSPRRLAETIRGSRLCS